MPLKGSLSPRPAALALFALSALAIAVALFAEHVGGLRPCPLCLDQRIAYYAVMPASLLALALMGRWPGAARALVGLSGAALLINAGLGGYHAGIEWGWWPGPQDCSGIGAIETDARALLDSLARTTVVRCDEAAFRLFGLSFAGYNVLLSSILAVLALAAAVKSTRVER